MFKELQKLLFLILATSNLFSQSDKLDILFVGHAYGSHKLIDNKLDPLFLNYFKDNSEKYDRVVLGGDFIYDCTSKEELKNFSNFYSNYNVNLVLGNHDICSPVIELLQKSKDSSVDRYESIGQNLIFFLNTSIENLEKINDKLEFIEGVIKKESPKNIIIFSHQIIFSKSDWYLRVNSRKYYQFGNNLYDKLYKKYYDTDRNFYFVAGDIGAFNFTPFSFYENDSNFTLLASGIGNDFNTNGIIIEIGDNINTKFIDLKSGKKFENKKYRKIKVQLYQFPKLVLFKLKKNYLFILSIIVTLILVYLFQNRLKKR